MFLQGSRVQAESEQHQPLQLQRKSILFHDNIAYVIRKLEFLEVENRTRSSLYTANHIFANTLQRTRRNSAFIHRDRNAP